MRADTPREQNEETNYPVRQGKSQQPSALEQRSEIEVALSKILKESQGKPSDEQAEQVLELTSLLSDLELQGALPHSRESSSMQAQRARIRRFIAADLSSESFEPYMMEFAGFSSRRRERVLEVLREKAPEKAILLELFAYTLNDTENLESDKLKRTLLRLEDALGKKAGDAGFLSCYSTALDLLSKITRKPEALVSIISLIPQSSTDLQEILLCRLEPQLPAVAQLREQAGFVDLLFRVQEMETGRESSWCTELCAAIAPRRAAELFTHRSTSTTAEVFALASVESANVFEYLLRGLLCGPNGSRIGLKTSAFVQYCERFQPQLSRSAVSKLCKLIKGEGTPLVEEFSGAAGMMLGALAFGLTGFLLGGFAGIALGLKLGNRYRAGWFTRPHAENVVRIISSTKSRSGLKELKAIRRANDSELLTSLIRQKEAIDTAHPCDSRFKQATEYVINSVRSFKELFAGRVKG